MSLISLKGIRREYGQGDALTVALKTVDLTIEPGEFIAVMGPSGSGKSTLMNIIGLLDTPTEGTYLFEEQDVSGLKDKALSKIRRRKIGFIFQSFNLLQRHTAIENVSLPMVYAKIERFSREAKASELLQKVGLEDRLYHFPNELSGGQIQRVAIARSLANSPSLILADEPTGNLDTKTGKNIMNLLKDLHKEGNTIVMVTHDDDVAEYAERVISLKDGEIDSDKIQNPATSLKVNKKEDKKEKLVKEATKNKSGNKTKKTKSGAKK